MIRSSLFLTLATLVLVLSATSTAQSETTQLRPPYSSSIDPIFDIIRESDPSVFSCMEYVGRGERQVWDKRVDGEPTIDAFLFRARYRDGADIEIAINPEFGSVEAARQEAEIYTKPLGQLPSSLREGIERFSVHKGDRGFHAGTGGIVMYADRARQRLSERHLEESTFHESVHASWDAKYERSSGWLEAQKRDGRFVTEYAAEGEGEDLAETALFAYGVSHFPGRIFPADTEDIIEAVPNRIKFIETLLPPGRPIFHESVGEVACN